MKTSAKHWPSGWALGQATWAKMTPTLLYLWRQSQKIHTPQPKNIFRVQSKRLADPFKPLNSSLAQLCPTQMAYWAKNYVTIFTRAT